MKPIGNKNTAIVCLIISVILFTTGLIEFSKKKNLPEPIPGQGVSSIKQLSGYFPKLKDTPMDTSVYFLEGENPGGTVFILGGTHPNEPAGMISAELLLENLVVESGRVIIIVYGNRSGFTHNDPQEASPKNFEFITSDGKTRKFPYGSRLMNPIHQWPDPDIYLNQFGQTLAGMETRNLNRVFPGKPDGTKTEQLAFGIMELIRLENVDLAIDLHEAALEYPVVNAIVAHEKSADLASMTSLYLDMEGISISLEPSPYNYHGLSHREWGDNSECLSVLLETANPAAGRFRGKSYNTMVVSGVDRCYKRAQELEDKISSSKTPRNILYANYPEEGYPLSGRVARHVTAIKYLIMSLSELYPDKKVQVDGIPEYEDILNNGIGKFLLSSSS
jgi:predicted deacylase